MEDERDDGGADAVEDRRHGRESLEVDVERGEARDDDEVRQDEGPAAGPRAPEAAAYIRDPDPGLDGERPGQRLADGDALAHLLLRQPLLLTHQLAFHLPDQRDRPTEAEQAEPQVVPNEITNRDTLGRLFGRHHRVSSSEALQECNA